jgi:ABC-type branched-subunit amino acid transport system substrate-binding protein
MKTPKYITEMHAVPACDLYAAIAAIIPELTPTQAATAVECVVRYALSAGVGTPDEWCDALPGAEMVEGSLMLDGTWHADDGNAEIQTHATTAQEAAEEYVEDGDWGSGGGSVCVMVWQEAIGQDGQDVCVNEEDITVDIPVAD